MLKHCGNAIISAGIVATDNSTAGDQKNVAATTSMPGSRNGPGCEPFPGLWPQLALKPALLNASEALHATPRDVSLKPMDQLAEAIPVMGITRPDDADGQPLPVPRSGQPFRPRSSNHTYSPSLSSGQKRGDCPRCSTSKITNHHSTITNPPIAIPACPRAPKSGQKRGDCPRCSTSKISKHHSTIINPSLAPPACQWLPKSGQKRGDCPRLSDFKNQQSSLDNHQSTLCAPRVSAVA